MRSCILEGVTVLSLFTNRSFLSFTWEIVNDMGFVSGCNSMIGGVLIVIGLYALLWAKGEEMKSMAGSTHSKSFQDQEAAIITVGTASAEAPVDDYDDVAAC